MNRLRTYLPEICIFLTLLSCYAYFFPRWADWNQNSRLDLTMAIVERGSLSIDDYHANTGDKLYFAGHYYCDKAPGLSFAAVPLYAVGYPILSNPTVASLLDRMGEGAALEDTLYPAGTGVNERKMQFAVAQYVLTLALVSIPSALLGVLLYCFLARFTSRLWPRLAVALAYGLGTTALPYSTTFYSHQLGAVLTFSAFFLVFRVLRESAPRWHLWVVGALLGYSVITEYPTGLIAIAIGLYAILGLRDWRAALPIVLAATPSILLWMVYNQVRFGAPLELGYQYHASFPRHAQAGWAGLAGPNLRALWDITFSAYRGLFFRSPFLLVAPVGFYHLWQQRRYRLEVAVNALVVIGYFLYASSFYDWAGGHAAGPRYLVAMLPFMAFPLITVYTGDRRHRWLWTITLVLVCASILLVGAETIAGQHFPYEEIHSPWQEYTIPAMCQGNIARNLGMIFGLQKWISLVPLLACLVGGGVWLYWLNRRPSTCGV